MYSNKSCDGEFHQELLLITDYVFCPFCNDKITEHTTKAFICCEKKVLIDYDYFIACSSCGQTDEYKSAAEYIDYIENKYKIKHKSFYRRKYHINNILTEIYNKSNISISQQERQKIIEIFKILSIIYKERKCMPSINYIIKNLLKLLNNKTGKILKFQKTKNI